MDEARRILDLFQAIQKLDYHPFEILVWYQTGTIEKGEEKKKLIKFTDAGIFGDWREIDNIEDVVKIIDDQWFR
jgi:hypothetical protein